MSPLEIHLLLAMHCVAEPLQAGPLVNPTSEAVQRAFMHFRAEGLVYDHVEPLTLMMGKCKEPWLTAKGTDFVTALGKLVPAAIPALTVRPPEPHKMGLVTHPVHGVYILWHNEGLFGINRDPMRATHCGYPSLSELFRAKGL